MILKAIIPAFLIYVAMLSLTCNNKPTPPDDKPKYTQSISLTAEDIGVVDAFIKIKFIDTTLSRAFKLTRDGATIVSAECTQHDTLILDEGLLPKRIYKYRAYRLLDNTPVDSSAELFVPTMDTTSHNFTWKIDPLGDGNSSVLRDVCIINDTCVWAVGEIYLKDSTGQFETTPYGAAMWNGKNWIFIKLPAQAPSGYTSYLIPTGILAFSSTDIWLTSGGVHRFDGQKIKQSFWINNFPGNPNPILDPGQTAEKLWGTSNSNLYVGGEQGAIAHFNGASWRRLESGTTLPIQDIWGDKNKITGELEIIAVAGNKYAGYNRKILKITNTTVTTLSDSGINSVLESVWFFSPRKYYVVGDGIYSKKSITEQGWFSENKNITTFYTNCIRGTGINNVFIGGDYGEMLHYNGSTWMSYQSNTGLSTGAYLSIAVNNNIVVAVGYLYPKAVALINKNKN